MTITCITDDPGGPAPWLARCEALHRGLRPMLPPDYAAAIAAVLADGAGMAVLEEEGEVRALAVFRAFRTTFQGHRFYVDDLVTAEAARSRGLGARMLEWCAARARALECDTLALDSGMARAGAHRFYVRQGFAIAALGFVRAP